MTLIRQSAAAIVAALALCHVASAGEGTATSQEVSFLKESFSFDEEAPAVGMWIGNINLPGSPVFAGSLRIQNNSKRPDAVVLTCLQINALDAKCTEVCAEGRSIAFQLSAGGTVASFSGKVSEDGQRLVGIIAQEDIAKTGTFTFARMPRAMDLPLSLAFTGRLKITHSLTLPLTIVLAQTSGKNWVGHVDSPVESLYELPLLNFHEKRRGRSTALTCSLLGFPATLNLVISANKESLKGRFVQEPYDLAIDFERAHGYAGARINRPQHPKPPLPYEAREIFAEHPEGHVLAGTLTIPDRKRFGPGPFPAALLITGGGQQDRDETIFGHKPFLVIADYLTRHGIAVMRYDDRGVGASVVKGGDSALRNLTTEDWATDALAVLDKIRALDVVDKRCIGLIGHSEGGLIGPMIAQEHPGVAFIVMLAGPGVPGHDVLPLQMSLLLRASGASREDVYSFRALAEKAIELVLADESGQRLDAVLREMARIRVEAGDPLSVEALADKYKKSFELPWVRFYLAYDPRPALAATSCPLLAMNGTLDLQIWHEQNLPEIERVMKAAGGDVTIKCYEGLNHLFQPAKIGSVAEYMEIETTIDEQVLRDLVKWIRSKIAATTSPDEP